MPQKIKTCPTVSQKSMLHSSLYPQKVNGQSHNTSKTEPPAFKNLNYMSHHAPEANHEPHHAARKLTCLIMLQKLNDMSIMPQK